MNHIPNPHHPSIDDSTHQQRSPFRSPYDPQNPQYASSSMDSHLSMAFIPLPIDTPLPASAFAMPPNGFNPPGHSPQQGPTGHPLYEGVVGMHYMLSQGMPWAEYNGYNSTRDTSQNEDDLFCQNPTPLVPLPIRPSTSRLSSQSSLQSWQSDCTETDSHPETSSSYKGTPPARPTPSATPTSPPQSTDTSITFQLDNPRTTNTSDKPDPYAASFIREKLGDRKWHIFTSRLAESRKGGQKSKSRSRRLTNESNDPDSTADNTGGASAVDFLVKVEVVKGVLRSFVPHPYNPLKSLTHTYLPSPRGHVTLSRTTVLALSGWSNTQFAYWARRAEGISVLSPFDRRLRLIATVLQRQLIEVGVSSLITDSSSDKSDSPCPSSPSTVSSGIMTFTMDECEFPEEVGGDPDKWVKSAVTGKGLDVMIDEVKKRSGVSPFLRGKHSSLDPFGAVVNERDADGNIAHREAPTVYMPTFQAEMYVHEVSTSGGTTAGIMATDSLGKRKASPGAPHPQPSPDTQHSSPAPLPTATASMSWPSLPSGRPVEQLDIRIDTTPHMSQIHTPIIHTPSPQLVYPDIFETLSNTAMRNDHSPAPNPIPSGPWNIDNFPLSHSRSQHGDGDVTMRTRSSSYSADRILTDRVLKKRKYSVPAVSSSIQSTGYGGYYQDLSSLSMSWDVHQMQGG